MAEIFTHDVFLSHSSQDKDIVRAVAERLRGDGLKVWFDEWEIRPGDSIPARIEEGLKRSRVLVLCMSANVFGSNWAQLESYTFRFRDPLNKDRRFIPLRLDEAEIEGSLAQFLFINWLPHEREKQYPKLLGACQPAKVDETDAAQPISEDVIQLACDGAVRAYAFDPKGTRVLTVDSGNAIRLWDMKEGRCVRLVARPEDVVQSIEWSDDEHRALVRTDDGNVRLLDVDTGRVLADYGASLVSRRQMECFRLTGAGLSTAQIEIWLGRHHYTVSDHLKQLRTKLNLRKPGELRRFATQFYKGDERTVSPLHDVHPRWVGLLAWIVERQRALSGLHDNDRTFRICIEDETTSRSSRDEPVPSPWRMAWSVDFRQMVSGHADGAVRLWHVREGRCALVLEGHTASVQSVAWNRNQRLVLSGSLDQTIRLWDVEAKCCLAVLKQHARPVRQVAWSRDDRFAFSGDERGGICNWNLSRFATEEGAQVATSPDVPPAPEQVHYTNAKVLLVGDSGVGKSGLSNYLAHGIKVDDDKPIPSTDGAWATHWPLVHEEEQEGIDREIWLWDFAGQVDYRLVHQLFMDDTAAAVLIFNPQTENPFEGLGRWDRDLQKAARKPFAKLLAAGRVDRGGLTVSSASIKRFMTERGFLLPLHLTSAKTGEGCDQLREAVLKAIDWQNIPETTSPALYHRMKREILHLRDSGLVLIRVAELKQRMELTLSGDGFKPEELNAVVTLLAGPGMIQRLDFGGFILLRPEVLSRYAAAVVRMVRKHPQEMGCIREDDLLLGNLDYQDYNRLESREDEAVVLRTLLDTFVSRAWCLRQPCEGTALLTFPSYFRRERREQPSHPNVLVTYRFDGPTEDIYATLVVRLHHTVAFESTDLWKAAADFRTQTGAALGFTLTSQTEGTSRLDVYFAPAVDANSRVLFLRYVHDHLTQHGQNVVRLRHYSCENKKCGAFGEPFADQAKVDKALAPGGKGRVFCPECGKAISLRDAIEQKFESPAVKEQVRELQVEVQAVIDNESRELQAVHHTGFSVAEAGQIYRGYTNSDHGIDGEIEFKDDQGRASGKRLYVQLKSGDSYLKKRQRDGAEVFQIKNARWADYWQQQAYAVMLVIRTSDGEIRWMDVSAYLKREGAGEKTVKQLVFDGERFDVMSVRRWRDRVLSGKPAERR